MNRPGSLVTKGAETRAALRRAGILTGVGAAGLLPALIREVGALAQQKVPPVLVHPALVFGGLAIAFGASFVAATHWELSNDHGYYRVECSIRKKRPADLIILGTSIALFFLILYHLFRENFEPR